MSVAPHPEPVFHGPRHDGRTARITTVALVTRNRLAPMTRALTSYVEHAERHGRALQFLVVDDSDGGEATTSCREALATVKARYGISVAYAGPGEKRRFAKDVIERGHVPPGVANFALFDVERCGRAYGANRNALLLATVGEPVFSADDDTVCRTVAAPESDADVAWVSGRDPAEFWFFPDRETALRSGDVADTDIFACHEGLLGRQAAEMLPPGGPPDPTGITAASGRSGIRPWHDMVVSVTFNGLVGDCAWGAPFGWWGSALGYLLLDEPSHRRLVRSAADYHTACRSREVLRVVRRPTLSDATFCMTTFVGLDNRRLLPPFMPVQRGEDIVFGATLQHGFGDRCFGHVPWALLHAPVPPRRFWPGEMVRTASGFDTAKLILACMPASEEGAATGRGLVVLGAHFIELGKLPSRDFDEYLRRRMRRINDGFAEQLEQRLHECEGAPEYWANDVRRYVALLREATQRPDYCVPLDLVDGRGRGEARVLAQRLVLRFGELLTWWPHMMEVATELRARDTSLATAV